MYRASIVSVLSIIVCVSLSLFARPNQKNADARALRMTRCRVDLQAQRFRLENELKVVSNELEEITRRLQDLECAARAPVSRLDSSSSNNSNEWDINTHGLFVENLRNFLHLFN